MNPDESEFVSFPITRENFQRWHWCCTQYLEKSMAFCAPDAAVQSNKIYMSKISFYCQEGPLGFIGPTSFWKIHITWTRKNLLTSHQSYRSVTGTITGRQINHRPQLEKLSEEIICGLSKIKTEIRITKFSWGIFSESEWIMRYYFSLNDWNLPNCWHHKIQNPESTRYHLFAAIYLNLKINELFCKYVLNKWIRQTLTVFPKLPCSCHL